MKSFFSLFLVLVCAGACATPGGKPPVGLTPVGGESLRSDIDLLISSLKRGYVGADFLPKESFAQVLELLRHTAESGPVNPVELCSKVSKILSKWPDAHVRAWLPGHACWSESRGPGRVGKNLGESQSPGSIYSLEWRNAQSVTFPVLSIRKFSHPKDPRWKGFEEAVRSILKAQSLIIDLRGNAGGHAGRAKQLARFLVNETVVHSKKKIYKKNTPEAWKLLKKNIELKRERLTRDGRPTGHLAELLESIQNGALESKKVGAPPLLVWAHKEPDLSRVNFEGNVYVLIDRRCGSSCEHAVELLKFHPKTKLVGEPTAGAIHFGQLGILELPNSQIRVGLSTHYFELFRSGFFEKTGYPPDVRTPEGTDALEQAVKIILGRWL